MTKETDAQAQAKRLAELTKTTQTVAQRWVDTPYYAAVEPHARAQWQKLILPFLANQGVDLTTVLEIDVGHGRMTAILLENSQDVIGVDVLQENIDFCAKRFAGVPNLQLIKNDGVTLKEIPSHSVSFVFCFDSMVHFDSDVVRSYLGEIRRVLEPEGTAFLHHSNHSRNPGGDFRRNAHARNFMSVELFKHYAMKEGLSVVKQKVISWGQGPKAVKGLDGLALLRKS